MNASREDGGANDFLEILGVKTSESSQITNGKRDRAAGAPISSPPLAIIPVFHRQSWRLDLPWSQPGVGATKGPHFADEVPFAAAWRPVIRIQLSARLTRNRL
jgi:hypothetical protein